MNQDEMAKIYSVAAMDPFMPEIFFFEFFNFSCTF